MTWLKRRVVAVIELIPGYALAWMGAQYIPPLTPWLPWAMINPYTVGAVISTGFNLAMWDRWVALVYWLSGEPLTRQSKKLDPRNS